MNAGVRTGSSGLFTPQVEGNDKYKALVVGLCAICRQNHDRGYTSKLECRRDGGLGTGVWTGVSGISMIRQPATTFHPIKSSSQRQVPSWDSAVGT
jgi:hypothetical protein